MNKKIGIFLAFFILAVTVVFVIGLKKSSQSSSSSVEDGSSMDEGVTDTDATEERDEEQEYFDQVEKNKEKIEEEGNIFPRDSYQVFDGYGYQIDEFKLFDSYDAFVNSSYYNPDYADYPVSDWRIEAQHKIAYVKYTVTNEDRYEKEFLVTTTSLIYAEDGVMRIHGGTNGDVDAIMDSKVENWKELEDEKQWWYFSLEPGESATIEQAFIFSCAEYDEEISELIPLDFDSVVKNPKWYLQIQGDMPMPSWTGEDLELKKMTTKIFIECE